jgi:hypothetical protein
MKMNEIDALIEIKKFQNAMQGENGKIILEHLKRICGQDRTTFDVNALTLAKNEGMRNVFIIIQNELNMDVDGILKKINDRKEFGSVLD